MIFCTAIEAQVVFKMLLALITGQLAIAGLTDTTYEWN